MDETLTLPLFDDAMVTLDPRVLVYTGSWAKHPEPHNYDTRPVRWCYERLMEHEHPIMLDIGANTGSFALLGVLHSGLTVYAFEPIPVVADVLRANCDLNGLTGRVVIEQVAVADYEGAGDFHIAQPENLHCLSILDGHPHDFKHATTMPVRVVTVDDYCYRNGLKPAVIKIDVEGGELEVLFGATEVVNLYRPAIVAEYSVENDAQYGYHPDEIGRWLEQHGYECHQNGHDWFAVWDGKERHNYD